MTLEHVHNDGKTHDAEYKASQSAVEAIALLQKVTADAVGSLVDKS